MKNGHADHAAAAKRTTEVHDIHDIRELTFTGAITLPQPRTPSHVGDSTASD